jgi:hypothetical protein
LPHCWRCPFCQAADCSIRLICVRFFIEKQHVAKGEGRRNISDPRIFPKWQPHLSLPSWAWLKISEETPEM